jgi:hypothetical protein
MFIRIYALATCFASMLCIAISTGVALYDLVQYSVPHLTVDTYQYQMRGQLIGRSANFGLTMDANGNTSQPAPPSEAEIAAQQEQQLAMAIERERANALRSLLQIFTILLVSVPLYIVHWRLAKRLDASAGQT